MPSPLQESIIHIVSVASAFQSVVEPGPFSQPTDYPELENSMKSLWAVQTLICAMATVAAQVNSAPTATPDALTPPSSSTVAQVATQESSAQDSNTTASASGIWLMTWTNEKGDTRHATLHIRQQGEALSGTANLQGGPINGAFRLTGTVRGNRIVLSVKTYWHHASFMGTVDGSKMSGSTHDGRPWSAAHE
jgi:hypothetical protein